MTGSYPRAQFHTHITPTAIHVSWGAECPGDECDGLQELIEEGSR
jgi:hypothetical protein